MEVADKQTETSTENKSRIKLAAREPIKTTKC